MQSKQDEEIRKIEKQIWSMEKARRWLLETEQLVPAELEIKIIRAREQFQQYHSGPKTKSRNLLIMLL